MGKRILVFAAAVLFLIGASGCITTNWAHNRRHFTKVRGELHTLHMEIDRIFFGMEEDPAEE
jgi:CHASE3 domain sensor protein